MGRGKESPGPPALSDDGSGSGTETSAGSSTPPNGPRAAAYAGMKVHVLRMMLWTCGLEVSGLKAALVEQLELDDTRRHIASNASPLSPNNTSAHYLQAIASLCKTMDVLSLNLERTSSELLLVTYDNRVLKM